MRSRGIEHGPMFAGLSGLTRSADGSAARAHVSSPGPAPGSLAIHPVLLDLCAQLLVATVLDAPGHGLVLPVGIAGVAVTGDLSLAAVAEARLDSSDADGFAGDVVLRDGAGTAVLASAGCAVCGSGCPPRRPPGRKPGSLEPRWVPAPPVSGPVVGRVLLVGEGGGCGAAGGGRAALPLRRRRGGRAARRTAGAPRRPHRRLAALNPAWSRWSAAAVRVGEPTSRWSAPGGSSPSGDQRPRRPA